MKNRYVTFVAILFALTCFGLLPTPKSFGVVPPPDGGYPGGNTAEGQNALLNLTTGGFNTAVGFLSLRSNTVGQFNTAIGAGTLLSNIADNNTAVGFAALASNFDGVGNSAFGLAALASNRTGSGNTAIGNQALLSNTGETLNGSFNTAVGSNALQNNHNGTNNTAIGNNALVDNTFGNDNTAIGHRALPNNTVGSNNIALGHNAGSGITDANSVICIGTNVAGFNVSDSCFIGNIYQKQVGADSLPVRVDSFGKLGTEVSSKRFKRDIKLMDHASEAILALKPVTFHYNSDNTNAPQFGLIAEDVAQVNPDLVVRDQKGDIYTVRYDAVNAMLLNEFIKEHRKVQEQQANITELKSTVARQEKSFAHQEAQIQALVSGLQSVSTQLQLNKPALRIVENKTD